MKKLLIVDLMGAVFNKGNVDEEILRQLQKFSSQEGHVLEAISGSPQADVINRVRRYEMLSEGLLEKYDGLKIFFKATKGYLKNDTQQKQVLLNRVLDRYPSVTEVMFLGDETADTIAARLVQRARCIRIKIIMGLWGDVSERAKAYGMYLEIQKYEARKVKDKKRLQEIDYELAQFDGGKLYDETGVQKVKPIRFTGTQWLNSAPLEKINTVVADVYIGSPTSLEWAIDTLSSTPGASTVFSRRDGPR